MTFDVLNLILLLPATFIAAVISGAAGFGGALLLLPLLVKTVGVEQAVPLLTVAQFVGNLSRAAFGFSQIRWKQVALFLLGAVPFSVAGAVSFVTLPKELMTRCIGIALLLFVALHCIGILKLKGGALLMIVGGGVVGFLSGLVGSAGPLGASLFLTLGLPPVAYVASEAITALTMHGLKMMVYHRYVSLAPNFWWLAALLGMMMIMGTWVAKGYIERIPRETFKKYVAVLLISVALYMLIHG